jgi:hypothetical protein
MKRPPLTLATGAPLALALVLAGCGGSSSPGVAHVGATSSASASSGAGGGTLEPQEASAAAQEKEVEFAHCMRTHGDPEFPEPVEGHIKGVDSQSRRSGLNPESPQFQAAERKCKGYLPSQAAPSPAQKATVEAQALKFAACMRSHGEPEFPDPTFASSGGGFQITISGPHSGIDPNSPQFKAAQKACRSVSPLGKEGRGHGGSEPG